MKSYWIWHYGDFEVYHFAKVCVRREEYGIQYAPMWKLDSPDSYIEFFKEFEVTEPGYIKVHTTGGISAVWLGGTRYPTGESFNISPGKYNVKVQVAKLDGLPSIYVESDVLASDDTWKSALFSRPQTQVGFDPYYDSPDINPEVFAFSYEHKEPISYEEIDGGILYDFGRETFGLLNVSNASPDKNLGVFYGESREEAIDTDFSILREKISGKTDHQLTQRAFRYVYIKGATPELKVSMEYEYLPYEYKGSFRCDNELFNKIYDVCAYTLHLNSREMFFDGIKRDRWVWGGDAFQSARFNAYLFADPAIERRTAIGLAGKAPYIQHINRIIDYTMLWIIGLYEHYMTYGDADYIKNILPRARGLMDLCEDGTNDLGFIVSKSYEWTFIDWSSIDKTGAVSAEQILLVAAYRTMAELYEIADEDPGCDYITKSNDLLEKVNKYFWNEEKGGYIDSYQSGAENVTRHANIFAIMFDIATPEQTDSIVKNVLKNDNITKITTPYFEGYELDVLAKLGEFEAIENMLDSYWGGMIRLGATSIWEEYNPKLEGAQHYSMYGGRYTKSLCHAWGAGPVYLFGKYYLGVTPTAPGYKTFRVAPNLGGLKEINGTVPAGEGLVTVRMNSSELRVKANIDGGVLVWDNEEYEIIKNTELVIKI
ncbi:MAG: alpha-rhamnosidase [Clostridia bacterium]|nr:alpha-rhamnosidase [Clostridia bacterium]